MPPYQRHKARLAFSGVSLNAPVDGLPPDKLGIATNVRPNQQGTLSTRPGLANLLAPASSPIHSLKTFTAEGSPVRRFSGASTKLYMDNTEVDSGYSGNPLSFAAYQPAQAIEPFLYVGDSQRFSKVRASDGTRYNVGIVPPSGPPDADLIAPLYSSISDFESATGWTAGGTAGSPSAVARVPSSTTIDKILYDAGSNGWACVAFSSSSYGWLTKGARIMVGGEFSVVTEMIAAPSTSTTSIGAIQYDSGTTGACCIVLASNTVNLQRNSFMLLNAELVRVLSVAVGEDNTVSFRCVSTGTHAAGETVTFYNCARMYLTTTHASGDAVTGDALTSAVTVGVGTLTAAATGSGPTLTITALYPDQNVGGQFVALNIYVTSGAGPVTVGSTVTISGTTGTYDGSYIVTQNPGPDGAIVVSATFPLSTAPYIGGGSLATTIALDLSQINGRPVTPDDWMHISLLIDTLANVSLIRILLDVDESTNDFTENYYYADVTANVFQQAVLGLQTNISAVSSAVQASLSQAQLQALAAEAAAQAAAGSVASASQIAALQGQLAQLEAGISSTSQLYTGASQWSEIFIPLSNLTRVGSDATVGLQAIKKIRVEITCIGTVNVEADSWWFGGTYGPNAPESINPEAPIKYAYRYRSTITGAQSTWSPLTRGGLFPERQGVSVSAAFSTDSQVDTIDFARVGASVNGTPLYLSSIQNEFSGGTGIFLDNYADAQLGDQIAPGDNQPWPVQQQPIKGFCTVVGTTVFATTVAIPTNLCEGTIVLVGGVATVIRGLPMANAFQVEDNLDPGTNVAFQINSPTTFGNPLPYMVGPFDDCFFAMGDPINPTRIYFTNKTNPDTAATSNYADLPTINAGLGVAIYNGYVAAMTSEEFIIGTSTGNTQSPFAFTTTSVGCGLLAPWAFTVGPGIFFWTRNGVAVTDYGPAKTLTNEDLYPYLPHEGVPGIAVNGYYPPPVNIQPRLAYCKNGWLYFDFQDTQGNYRTLAFDTTKPGWWFDEYTPGVTLHYQDEQDDALVLTGCADGSIRQFSSDSQDGSTPIACQVRLGANNFGDFRSLKQMIDIAIELNGTVTVQLLANSWTVSVYTQNATGTPAEPIILPVAAEYDPTKLYLDFALDLSWTGQQQIIEYDLGYLQNPLLAADFVANPTPLGFTGYGHVREVILNTISTAAFSGQLVIACEFPGTITIPVSIPAGPARQYITLPPNKGMLYEWALQGLGSDFGLFACDAHVKGWTEAAYRTAMPFVE